MKSFPSPWKGVRSLIKKYPDDKNKIMESLICCSDEELKNCIDMTNFCLGLYGKSATNIIGRRPIDCFVKIYRDCSDDQRDRLVDKILSNTDLFSFVFSNADVLLDIINPGFTYTATLTNMDNISKYKDKIIKKYMSSIFNAYKLDEKIDEILIEGFRHNKFKEIINCCTNEQKNKVFVRLISTPTVFCRLIRNSEDLEKISNDFSEYALIFKLNFELRKAIESDIDGEVSEAFKCLSSIQEAIKSAFTNGTIKYESLQLFSSFLSFFAILPEQVVPGELTKKLAELYNYLSTIKIPSLAELCVDSLVHSQAETTSL